MSRICMWLMCLFGASAQAQMTIRQSLEVRAPSNLQYSPDGAQVAYVVRQAVLADDSYRHTLQVTPVKGGPARTLVSTGFIGTIQWSGDGKSIIYLGRSGDVYQAWQVGFDGKPPRQLTHQPSGIGAGVAVDYLQRVEVQLFRLSPDGRKGLYFTRDRVAAEKELASIAVGNFLYTESDSYAEVTAPRYAWTKMPAAAMTLWLVDMDSGAEKMVWRSPAPGQDAASVPIEFAWSPDGKSVALLWTDKRNPKLNRRPLVLLSGEDFTAQDLLPNLGHAVFLEWEPDGRAVTFYSYGEITEQTNVLYDYYTHRYSLADRRLVKLGKDQAPQNLLQARIKAATGGEARECVHNARRTQVACVRVDTMHPPEVATYDLTRKGVAGAGRVLTHLNPELDGVRIGQVQAIRGRPEDGVDSGLILPVDYSPDKRYPLVVILYNQYDPGIFTGALPFTSYPAQAFAANGYMVILQNLPVNTHVYPAGDFATARANEADGVAASLRGMLDQLIAKNMIDPQRVGIMGWSWGGFFTPYMATHYPDWFRAAAMGEGGNHQPTSYWASNSLWRRQEDRFFGEGGPHGPHADRWRSVSPLYNVDKLRVPVLMEYSGALLSGLELHRAILDTGGISELHVYPRELHVFERPSNRFDSMRRHFDWFHFWLSGQENPDSKLAHQYERWRALRADKIPRNKVQN